MKSLIATLVLTVVMFALKVSSHGRLLDPPSRGSAWRFGWDTPVNYNDNEGYCGGFSHQWLVNGGKCGICGDAWEFHPRPHEVGGKYATGTIVKEYVEGQVVLITLDISANHGGVFEFRLCPTNNRKVEASQTCLNDYPLFPADGSDFQIPVPKYRTGEYKVEIKLPDGLMCSHCVMQWRYAAANNWGVCENGTSAVGCGPQEEFRACADVTVHPRNEQSLQQLQRPPQSTYLPPTPGVAQTVMRHPTLATEASNLYSQVIATPGSEAALHTPSSSSQKMCFATGLWRDVPGMHGWCHRNCNHVPSFCPASHCHCSTV